MLAPENVPATRAVDPGGGRNTDPLKGKNERAGFAVQVRPRIEGHDNSQSPDVEDENSPQNLVDR